MIHRSLVATIRACVTLGILLASGAAPAIDLVGQTSANLQWTAASGPVAGYGVFIARNGAGYPAAPNFTVPTTTATVTGVYGDSITVRVAAYTATGTYGPSSPASDPIRFIAPPTPTIALSTASLTASAQAGTNPPDGSFTVRNSGSGTLTYTVSDNQSWLSVTPTSGTSTGEADPITVHYDTTGLAAGSYLATISVDGGAGVPSKAVTVSLTVTAPPPPPAITLSTASLSTSTPAGGNPGSQTFTIRNSGGGTLGYAISDDQSWLSVAPASGTSTGESDTVTVTYAASALSAGTYTATITASASGVASKTVSVTLTVNAATQPAAIALSPASLAVAGAQGQSPSAQTFTVRNSGGGTLSYSITDNQSWLSVAPASGTSTGESDTVTLTFSTGSLPAGTHTATVTVAGGSGVASQTLQVTLTLSAVSTGNARAILVGVGEGGTGAIEVLNATASFAWNRSLTVDWPSYAASVGETRPAACDVDGDGNAEYVVGLGTGGDGRLEVLQDGPGGYVHLAWLQVTLAGYGAANGETFPACGDVDGDGKDEIVVGFGTGGAGRIQIFDDASTGYAVMTGTPIAGGFIQIDYATYNSANGETHPAVGDFDGDGKDEIAVGVGNGGFGWVVLYEDKAAGFAPMTGTPNAGGWIPAGWNAYNAANGATYPAAGDFDGDGKDELVVGLGPSGQGYLRMLDDKTAGFASIGSGWLQLDASAYNASTGATYPALGNLDGDAADEILVGLGSGGGGQMKAYDDASTGFAGLAGTGGASGWMTLSRTTVSNGGGATRPAIGSTAGATTPPPGQAAITLSETSLSSSAVQGSNAASRTFTVRNSGAGTLNWSVSDDQSWMSVAPASGTSTGENDTLTVTFASSGLTAGTRTGTITVGGGSGVTAKTVAVTLTVTTGAAAGPADGVASFAPSSGQWIVLNATSGSLESSVKYAPAKDLVPLYGDWNGDGVASLGAFQPSTATWYLRNTPGTGNPEITFQYGPGGAMPVVGDWNGDGRDSIGVFYPANATFYLRNANSAGNPDLTFAYGFGGVMPVAGDWNADGVDTIGIYHPASGQWYLRDQPGGGNADRVFQYGYGGTQPMSGDWNGDGRDGIGIFDPASGTWMLREQAGAGGPDRVVSSKRAKGGKTVAVPGGAPELPAASVTLSASAGDQLALFDPASGEWVLQYGRTEGSPVATFTYGGGGFVPVHGDWNGDGVATLGVFQTATGTWYLRNGTGPGAADVVFTYGPGGSIPLVGDWNADGRDTIGVFVPSTATFYLRNTNSAGNADSTFQYGFGGVIPVAGDWNGDGRDTIGVYYPPTGMWYLRNASGSGNPDLQFGYGYAGTKPVVGDWDANGTDGVGVYDPASGRFLLRNAASSGSPNVNTSVGGMTGGLPVVWKP